MSGHILTSKGLYFPFDNPYSHPFDIDEIAHALSHICRFTGHVRSFYSVAQHSVHVAELVPAKYRLEALLHDASEAYLGDVASPLKALLPDYKAIERKVEHAIALAFGLDDPMSPEIKQADMRMLITERRDLLPRGDERFTWPTYQPAPFRIYPLDTKEAKALFIAKYEQYLYERLSYAAS